MRKHALLRVAIIILTLSVAVALIAEHAEFTYFPDQVGTIQPVKVETGPGKGWNLSPSEQKVFYGNLTTLRDSFLAQPVFKPPKGFQVSGYARAEGEGGRSGIPVRGWGRFRYIPYVVSNDYNTGKPSPGKAPYPWEYLESDVYLHVNDPTAGIGHFGAGGPYFPFDDTPVLIQPQKIGERQGFALYSSKPGDQVSPFLVLTRSAKPLWVPMSQ